MAFLVRFRGRRGTASDVRASGSAAVHAAKDLRHRANRFRSDWGASDAGRMDVGQCSADFANDHAQMLRAPVNWLSGMPGCACDLVARQTMS